MEAEARYTRVGIAVLALVAALTVALLWLRGGPDEGYARYAIYFEEQALDGLNIGADVTLRGIRIGNVEDYGLPGGDLSRVRVQIRVDQRTQLRTNTSAVITRNFVTGIAAIKLVVSEPPGPVLVEVPPGESVPVIAEGTSDLQEIAGRVNQVGEIATQAIGNLNQLLAEENRAVFIDTVRHFGTLAAGLEKRLVTLDSTLDRIGVAATKTGNAMAEIGEAATGLGRSGERLATVAERSGAQLDSTLAESSAAIAEAQQAFARIAEASDVLQQRALASAERLERSAVNIDDQLTAAVTELRQGVEAGNRVLDRLREPRAALLGPAEGQLGPGERLP